MQAPGMSRRPPRPLSQQLPELRHDRDPVRGEQRLGSSPDHGHNCVIAVPGRRDERPHERRHEQRRVDTAREGHLAAALERHEPLRQRRERARVGNGVVDDDRVELRQLLPRRPHDADRTSVDTRPHDGDRVLDRGLPMPVEQRLRRAHPRRPPAREHDRARAHLSGRRAPGRAGSRTAP